MPPERSRHHVERAAAGEVCGSPGRVCGPRVRRWACGVERVAQGRSHARTATHGAICFACGDHTWRRGVLARKRKRRWKGRNFESAKEEGKTK